MFSAPSFYQITQQLEDICLQVIGLVLQKPIIGMAGVSVQMQFLFFFCIAHRKKMKRCHIDYIQEQALLILFQQKAP